MWVDSYGSRTKYISKRWANKTIRQKNRRYLHSLPKTYHDYCYSCWDGDPKEDYHKVPDGKAYRKYFDPWNIVDSKYEYQLEGYWYCNFKGELVYMEPDPRWKAIRK